MFLIAPLFYKIIKKSAFPPLEINRVKPATAIIAVIAGVLTSSFAQSGLALLPIPQEIADQQVNTFSFVESVPLFIVILGIGILGPIGEELFLRGGVFQTMRRDSNALVASVVSAALFGLAHLPVVQQMGYTFVMGLIWALVCHFTKSILPCIIVHVINNSWLMILPESASTPAIGLMSGSYAWAVFAASAVLLAGCIYLMARLEKGQEWKVLTGGRNSQLVA
jgi:Predicted metal-dependent membrane protease